MRRALILITTILLSLLVAGVASAASLPGLVSASRYRVQVSGSISVDWSEKVGDVGASCRTWSDESGSSTVTFTSRRSLFISLLAPNQPFTFGGPLPMKAKERRSWKRRYGEAYSAGCSGVCPEGTTARASDGTCAGITPPRPTTGDDCGLRRSSRGFVSVDLDEQPEDDPDLAPLVPPAAKSALVVRPPILTLFRKCRTYTEGLLAQRLPIVANANTIKLGRKNRTYTFRRTKTNIPCESPLPTGVTCSRDFTVKVTVRRIG